jgi:hypothetical protein
VVTVLETSCVKGLNIRSCQRSLDNGDAGLINTEDSISARGCRTKAARRQICVNS